MKLSLCGLRSAPVVANQVPLALSNDAGADVYMPYDCTLQPGEIAKVPLGFGIEVPDGYAGFVFPRTSMAIKGLVCELPPVDSATVGKSMPLSVM